MFFRGKLGRLRLGVSGAVKEAAIIGEHLNEAYGQSSVHGVVNEREVLWTQRFRLSMLSSSTALTDLP